MRLSICSDDANVKYKRGYNLWNWQDLEGLLKDSAQEFVSRYSTHTQKKKPGYDSWPQEFIHKTV
jgi:hypothetical protein